LLNHIEYKDWKRVFFQFIPEWIFFQGIFGYLVFAIFFKWYKNWNDPDDPTVAPSLLTMLINMFMSPGSDIEAPLYFGHCFDDCANVKADGFCSVASLADKCQMTCLGFGQPDALCAKSTCDAGDEVEIEACASPVQTQIQLYLLLAAVVAVPFLLLPIPFIEWHEHNKSLKYTKMDQNSDSESGGDDEHEFSIGDAFIHQGIHTIEFVLGSISNTASYLRLWALSLAHSQLAELFMDMILIQAGFAANCLSGEQCTMNPLVHALILFFTFAIWAVISFVVLMVMENLSSFLHALRLQWVEFQNKFFYGDGRKFTPFSFKEQIVLHGDE